MRLRLSEARSDSDSSRRSHSQANEGPTQAVTLLLNRNTRDLRPRNGARACTLHDYEIVICNVVERPDDWFGSARCRRARGDANLRPLGNRFHGVPIRRRRLSAGGDGQNRKQNDHTGENDWLGHECR